MPAQARACPACGADERTGWNVEMTRYDGVDLPDEEFEYDEALRDGGLKTRHRPKGVPLFSWLVGSGLLLVIIALVLHCLN